MSELTKPATPAEESANTKASADGRRAAIRAGVLAALGNPTELLQVTVVPLWGDKFRVNVWTGGNKGATIPNSYFVTADERGTVLTSEPPIAKQY